MFDNILYENVSQIHIIILNYFDIFNRMMGHNYQQIKLHLINIPQRRHVEMCVWFI